MCSQSKQSGKMFSVETKAFAQLHKKNKTWERYDKSTALQVMIFLCASVCLTVVDNA
jgi:hypothetical protein